MDPSELLLPATGDPGATGGAPDFWDSGFGGLGGVEEAEEEYTELEL